MKSTAQPSRNWLVYGCEQKPTPPLPLRAGPLHLLLDRGTGFIRRISLGEHEVLRGIYAAVRDRNWGTVAPMITGFQSKVRRSSFTITFRAVCRQDDIHFVWNGRIQGTPRGVIHYEFDGEAKSTFLRNRIGFCVLHPIRECAGAWARQIRTDGRLVKCRFPRLIEPQIFGQSSFRDLRAVAHQIAPGLWAEVEFAGDVFEMEDQRNWTDASFKTYCTPLALPFPVKIEAGTRIRQSVTLRLHGSVNRIVKRRVSVLNLAEDGIILEVPRRPLTPLPQVGLGMASHGKPLSQTAVKRLRALRLSHLRVDLRLSAAGWLKLWELAVCEASRLGVGLELALHLPPKDTSALEQCRQKLRQAAVPLIRVLALREGEAATTPETIATVKALLVKPDVPVGAGSDANFCELNREQALGHLATTGADFFFWSINPQVHAFDHLSIMETLEAQAATVETARAFAGDKPLVISPITLKPRFNAVATGPQKTKPGEIPASVDLRQCSLFAAAWTLGSLAALGRAEVQSVTLYETTGWRGVLELQTGSNLSAHCPAFPVAATPIYLMLAELANGCTWTPIPSTDAGKVVALAGWYSQKCRRILLANLTPQPQRVRLVKFAMDAHLLLLDVATAYSAMSEPERFLLEPGRNLTTSRGVTQLILPPYSLAILDGQTNGFFGD